MKINAIICIGILFMIFPSCQKNDRQPITQPQKQTVELRQIPVEEALATLTEFLQENKGDLRDTRSGRPREIVSVSTYYGSHKGTQTETRAANEHVDSIPNAYLVNFGNGEGFAVLGANTAVPEIVAVTENGQIEEDLTVIFAKFKTVTRITTPMISKLTQLAIIALKMMTSTQQRPQMLSSSQNVSDQRLTVASKWVTMKEVSTARLLPQRSHYLTSHGDRRSLITSTAIAEIL